MSDLLIGVLQKAIALRQETAIAFVFVYQLIYVSRRYTSNVDL
ncbi:hypothetical protein [Scytonema sp. PRP1]